MGITYSPKVNSQESVFIKHDCKLINHGYFTFCAVTDNQTINKVIFSYSLDLKKKSYAVMLLSKDTLSINTIDKTYLNDFSGSDVWNQKRLGPQLRGILWFFIKIF
jgi:fibronectin type 3 domain-containing protein